MKHLKAAVGAMLIPLLGVCSCSSQRAAAKDNRENAEPVKRVETDLRMPPPVVYGPPPSVYEKMPEPVIEDNNKKD